MDSLKKLKRFSKIVSVLSKYGFEEILSRGSDFLHNEPTNEIFNANFNQRFRLVLEELGPTYIKFGQLLSNRKDLVPEALIEELKKLQDNVPPEEIDIRQKIKDEFDINPDEHFLTIDELPFAAASISQVYRATLLNGEEVIFKVKRSNIQKIIESDLALIRDIIHFLEKKYEKLQKLFVSEIEKSFENSIIKELSLTNELQNIERFRKNFENSKDVYVPKTYPDYSNNNFLCMEFIDGYKVNDVEKLQELGLDPKKIVQKGFDIYLKQLLEDGFFHADPHPGNIFILKDGRTVFIDFGSMGILAINEKEALENVVIDFGLKNPKRIVRSLKKMAIKHFIDNEKQLERDIADIFDYLEYNTVDTIEVQVIIKKFNHILHNNHVLLPEYVYILMRGIALIEGIGQQLHADLNVQRSMRPYAIKLARQKFHPKYLSKKAIDNLKDVQDLINDLPEDTLKLIEKINHDKLAMNFKINEIDHIEKLMKDSINKIVLAILTLTFGIGASMLANTNVRPMILDMPLLSWVGYLLSVFTAGCIIILVFRKK
ncbi:Probable ubiquinone biosynthesis protein UbiB [Algoriella xinjiangensis]|uniref:ABC1 kinase family protein n=1 Tax=Algoriella xinjiangensis TaxID=684065 RepID=UPI000F62D9C7|nr:AarF/UbiB family protein [Algoriella xinjiangensis]VDH18154.1 Probable ubiquinone biosynthesis protein UbiB [Algoriella xinjiangensis]